MEAYLDSQSAPRGDVLACIWVPIHGKLGLELDNILPLAVWLDGLKVLEVALLIFFSRFKKDLTGGCGSRCSKGSRPSRVALPRQRPFLFFDSADGQ
jgi:hypothetical protein